MLTPRRSGYLAIIGRSSAEERAWEQRASPARPVDRVDDRGRAQGGDDVGEVADVLDLDVDQDLEEVDGAVGDLQIVDVAAVLADDRGQAAEAAGLVTDGDVDAADM